MLCLTARMGQMLRHPQPGPGAADRAGNSSPTPTEAFMRARVFVLCSLVLSIASVSGCGPSGPKMHEVTGTVTYDGEAVKTGDINFVPEDTTQGPEGGKIVDGK